jgi:hypothetical protein
MPSIIKPFSLSRVILLLLFRVLSSFLRHGKFSPSVPQKLIFLASSKKKTAEQINERFAFSTRSRREGKFAVDKQIVKKIEKFQS